MADAPNPFLAPTPVRFGDGVSDRLGDEAREFGMHHVFFVTDKSLIKHAASARLISNLRSAGLEVTVFSDVEPEPSAASVDAAAQIYAASGADSLVGYGGGSPMDFAKGIGVVASGSGNGILDYTSEGSLTPALIPPLICVPTTAGTGSEITFIAIFVADGAKRLVRHISLAPRLAIIDPELTAGMPPSLTASTGLDALSHALEALTSSMSRPESDVLALSAAGRIGKWLPIAVNDGSNLEARSEMCRAATDAGVAFMNARVHLGHAVGHALGTEFHIPHGFACAMCLPAILDFLRPGSESDFEKIAAAIGRNGISPFLNDLLQETGAPRLGAATGCTSSDIPRLIELVENTEGRLIALSRRRPSPQDWERIFSESF